MHTRNWTWMVLVASGALAWACGGDDDGADPGSTTTGGSTNGGSGGSSGSGGTGGGSGGTGGTGGTVSSGGSGPSTTGDSTGGTTSTSTTAAGTGGSAGGAGDAGAAGMAGAAGGGGDELSLEELCEADCAKLVQVGCLIPDASTCVQDFCMSYVNYSCEAEYREYLECEAAADLDEFVCVNDAPNIPASCTELYEAATTYCEG